MKTLRLNIVDINSFSTSKASLISLAVLKSYMRYRLIILNIFNRKWRYSWNYLWGDEVLIGQPELIKLQRYQTIAPIIISQLQFALNVTEAKLPAISANVCLTVLRLPKHFLEYTLIVNTYCLDVSCAHFGDN